MPAVETVFKLPVRNWLFPENYNWAKGKYKVAGEDREIAIIREYLLGNTANVRLTAQQANDAVSMLQTFDDAAATIRNNLTLMVELAEEALKDYYSHTDRASMQKELEELAKIINDIAANTEYDNNKFFTVDGQAISSSLGNGQTINLLPKDLSFNIENVDLTKDAKSALATIKDTLKKTSEYTDYLSSQNERLQNAMTTIERRTAAATGIESGVFETKIAQKIMAYLAAMISEQPNIFSNSQANITPDEALQLLKDADS
ncbi:MAG: flagellin [Planctomycetota bacterium]|jgi:flagellin-like hook-associated protein FlgL